MRLCLLIYSICPGQNPTTRAEGLQRKIQIGITLSKLQYRWSRNALFRLKGHGDWETELRVLADGDVQGMNERMLTDDEARQAEEIRDRGLISELIAGPSTANAVVSEGEGRRRPSWIWSSYAEGLRSESDPITHEGECRFHSRLTPLMSALGSGQD